MPKINVISASASVFKTLKDKKHSGGGMDEIIVIHDKPFPAHSYRLNRTSASVKVYSMRSCARIAKYGQIGRLWP
jgi:hypothetical protein